MSQISTEVNKAYLNKLKGKLYGLLCEREKNRDWEKFYDNIMIELMGFPEEHRTINYEILMRKMSSCKYLRFQYFRGVILECMNLISAMEE
ncbi:MAG: hypothetical protein PHQ86_07650 [Dehalococcoidales bacterium]|nr:hypothetical protein [Dehalococcoidales bacterium]